jgi:hypothetical protein
VFQARTNPSTTKTPEQHTFQDRGRTVLLLIPFALHELTDTLNGATPERPGSTTKDGGQDAGVNWRLGWFTRSALDDESREIDTEWQVHRNE